MDLLKHKYIAGYFVAVVSIAAVLCLRPVEAKGIPEKTMIPAPITGVCETEAPAPQRTDAEIADIEALAKMLWGEARGVKSTTEKAACVWVVLNRVDNPLWPDSVLKVLEQPYQFGGYSAGYTVDEDLRRIAADVYDRWQAERDGADEGAVMRVIPDDYYYWRGERGGKHNWFRRDFTDYTAETYTFDLDSPYED